MTTEIAVNEPTQTEFQRRAQDISRGAHQLAVVDEQSLNCVVRFRANCRAYLAELDATFDESIKAAHEAHKKAIAAKNALAGPVKEADTYCGQMIANFRAAEERRVEREKREAEGIARKKAEADREKELKRIEKTQGKAAAKEAAKAPLIVAPVIVKEAAQADGVSYRDKFIARVVDASALIAAVAADKAAPHFVTPDISALTKFAQATKGSVAVPGVEFVVEKVVVQKSV